MTKPTFAPALLATLALTLPSSAFAGGTGSPTARTSEAASIRSAAERVVRTEVLHASASELPAPRPYQGRDRSRKQMGGGGSKTGMVIGVVSALAGTAATIYMVKEMQKNNNRNDGQ
jgi:hypothetical protein